MLLGFCPLLPLVVRFRRCKLILIGRTGFWRGPRGRLIPWSRSLGIPRVLSLLWGRGISSPTVSKQQLLNGCCGVESFRFTSGCKPWSGPKDLRFTSGWKPWSRSNNLHRGSRGNQFRTSRKLLWCSWLKLSGWGWGRQGGVNEFRRGWLGSWLRSNREGLRTWSSVGPRGCQWAVTFRAMGLVA